MPTQVATQPAMSMSPARHPHAPQVNPVSENAQVSEKNLENEEEDALQAARASFEAREFYHATHLLQDCRSAKAKFLRIYSQFIASEKKAQRDWHKLDNNRHQPPVPINKSLSDLLEIVQNVEDPWLLFLLCFFLACPGERKPSRVHLSPWPVSGGIGLPGRCWEVALEMEKSYRLSFNYFRLLQTIR